MVSGFNLSNGDATSRRLNLRCDRLFLENGTRDAVALPAVLNGQMTVMRFQFSQGGGPAAEIPSHHILELFRLHGVPGDPFFPKANGDYTRLVFSNTSLRRQIPTIAPAVKLSPAQLESAVEKFIRLEYSHLNIPESQWRPLIQAAKETPSTVAQAIEAYQSGALGNSGAVQAIGYGARATDVAKTEAGNRLPISNSTASLQNEFATSGAARYFYFSPASGPANTPARILDIHKNPSGSIHIFAEWFSQDSSGLQVREVGMVSLDEMKTIAKLSINDRISAASAFFESLTPNQLAAQMLAQKLNLKPFGYTDFMRAPGMDGASTNLITEKMSNLGHHSVRFEAQERFGNFDFLLTEAERANANWNAIDVFGRLSPDYLLTRFGSRVGYKYIFVITEDGQLKISPLGPSTTNLRPQLLRLGHGRKVFTAGYFVIDSDGRIQVTRRTADYSSWDGSTVSGSSENRAENYLIRAVFQMQAAAEISMIDSAPSDTWSNARTDDFYRGDEREFRGQSAKSSGSPFHEFDSQEAKEFVNSMLHANRKQQKSVPDWNRNNVKSKPPTFEEWSARAGLTTESNSGLVQARLDYAHFVLGTNPNQTFREIRQAYRLLQMKFYPRDGKGNDAASQRINDAFKVFKEKDR